MRNREGTKGRKIRLSKDNLTTIKGRLSGAQGSLHSECLNIYSRIVYPYSTDMRLDTVSMLDSKTSNLTDAIVESSLEKKGKIAELYHLTQ